MLLCMIFVLCGDLDVGVIDFSSRSVKIMYVCIYTITGSYAIHMGSCLGCYPIRYSHKLGYRPSPWPTHVEGVTFPVSAWKRRTRYGGALIADH